MIALAVIGLLLALILLQVPIGYALGIAGAIGILVVSDLDNLFGIVGTTPYRMSASWILTALPLFVLMAEFMTSSGLAARLFEVAHRWLSWIPGSLAVATVFSTAVFGAISGSSTAAVASAARTAVPEMQRYGYDRRLAAGTVAVAGTLAIIIPPSVVLIIYGILTETSIGGLFAAAVIPGILTAAVYTAVVVVWVLLRPEIAPRFSGADTADSPGLPGAAAFGSTRRRVPAGSAAAHDASSAPVGHASSGGGVTALDPAEPALRRSMGREHARDVLLVLALFIVVIGGIYSGVVTVTEAAAVGATGALGIALVAREMSWSAFWKAVTNTAQTSAMIFTIMIGAQIFGYFLTLTKITSQVLIAVQESTLPRWGIMVILLLVYLALGAVMDQMAIIILTLPLSFPLVMSLGYDPIWFGIILVKTVEIGLATPPFGLNVFVTGAISKLPLVEGFKGAARFVAADLALLALFVVFPGIPLALA